MLFSIDTFLNDVRDMGKLQFITYDNGAEALNTIKQLTTTCAAQAAYSANPIFEKIAEQLTVKDKAFGFIVGKANKGLKAYYRFNVNAFLLKNGKLVLYKPYNDVVSLAVSGSRKMTYNGTADELYTATVKEIFNNTGGRNEGIRLYDTYDESYSWNIPSNAAEVLNLLFTHVIEEATNLDSVHYEGVLIS